MSRRTDRVAEVIRQEVGRMILAELSDPRIGFVTVTRVDVSADLSYARVFVSVMDTPARQRTTLQGLQSAQRRIQSALSDALKLRRTPQVSFHLDEGVKRSIHMSEILSDLARERKSRAEAQEDDDSQEEPKAHDR